MHPENKKIGLWLYHNHGGDVIEQKLVKQLQDRGFEVITNLDLKDTQVTLEGLFCHGQRLNDLSCFFSYNCSAETPYQLYFYQLLNTYLPVINNYSAFALTEDKLQTNQLLRRHHILTPTYCFCPIEDKQTITDFFQQHHPLVAKPIDGYGGHHLVQLTSLTEATSFNGYRSKTGFTYFYAEKFIRYDKTDYRIDIVDGQVIACYGRKAKAGDWRTNVTSGGSIMLRERNNKVITLAEKAAKLSGLEIAGVDIIFDQTLEEYVVLEINGLPAFATPEQEKLGLTFNDRKITAITQLIEQKAYEQTQYPQTALAA